MPNRGPSAAVCLAVVLAMALALLLQPRGPSSSHDPFALMVAAAVQAADDAGHGPMHDDGGGYEPAVGHAHGHNSGDHAHDQTGTLSTAAAELPPPEASWPIRAPAALGADADVPPERPPKPDPAA